MIHWIHWDKQKNTTVTSHASSITVTTSSHLSQMETREKPRGNPSQKMKYYYCITYSRQAVSLTVRCNIIDTILDKPACGIQGGPHGSAQNISQKRPREVCNHAAFQLLYRYSGVRLVSSCTMPYRGATGALLCDKPAGRDVNPEAPLVPCLHGGKPRIPPPGALPRAEKRLRFLAKRCRQLLAFVVVIMFVFVIMVVMLFISHYITE